MGEEKAGLIEVAIGDTALTVRSGRDQVWYQQRHVFEEVASPLYPLLRRMGVRCVIDVGANYGLIGVLAAKQLPGARVLCVEADPGLVRLIGENFARNNLDPPQIFHAIAGDSDQAECSFSLNPTTTLDNRVSIAGWQQVAVPMIRLDTQVFTESTSGPVFIKIDTQGFEPKVLAGLDRVLSARADWLIKMEFAPNWLQSQGHDPLALLRSLLARFEVAEFPERIPWGTRSLNELFRCRLKSRSAEQFLNYVVSLNGKGLGWVDLIVRPKRFARIGHSAKRALGDAR